jgi:hypothetical protein
VIDLRTTGNRIAAAIARALRFAGRMLFAALAVFVALLVAVALVGGLIYALVYFLL